MSPVTLVVDGMTCQSCVNAIYSCSHAIDGVASIHIDLPTGIVTIDLTPDAPIHTVHLVSEAIRDAGFDVTEPNSSASFTLVNYDHSSTLSCPIVRTPSPGLLSTSTLDSPSTTLTVDPSLSSSHIAFLSVRGMTCTACVGAIERVVRDQFGVLRVSVSLLGENATIYFDPDVTSPDTIVNTINDAGFEASILSVNTSTPLFTNPTTGDKLLTNTIDLEVYGMTCTVCSGTIEREVGAMSGVVHVSVSLSTKRAKITVMSGQVGIRDLIQRIEDLGFDALVPNGNHQVQIESLQRTREIVEWRNAFIWCLIFAIPNMLIGMLLPMMWPRAHMEPSLVPPSMADKPGHLGRSHTMISSFPLDTIHIIPGLSLNNFLQLLLTIPVQFGTIGRKFYRSAYKSIKLGTATMDVLVSLGTTSAFIASLVSLLYAIISTNHPPPTTFFDTCTMLLTFVALGRYLENSAKGKTSTALTQLLSLKPASAILLAVSDKDPGKIISEQTISAELIQVGDVLRVQPGERVPADGEIIFGTTQVDESMVTGEAIPVPKKPGSSVIAGTVNGAGCVHVRAVQVGQDTALARIASLVEHAQASKAPTQRWADKVAGVFVPVVVSLAILTFITWLSITLFKGHFPFRSSETGDDNDGNDVFLCLQICISVIVVACPCTLGLSVPTAVMVGTGVGAQLGILIKGGESLERIHKLDHLILDKTGTLTEGKMTVRATEIFLSPTPNASGDLHISEVEFWSIVGATEANSEHPLARAMIKYSKKLNQNHSSLVNVHVTDFKSIPGQGVQCNATITPSGRTVTVAIGSLSFIESIGIITKGTQADALGIVHTVTGGVNVYERQASHTQRGHTVVFVALGNQIAGLIAIGDQLKPHAARVINALQNEMGINIYMVTGDNPTTAHMLAKQAGISRANVYAGVSPAGKAKIVRALQDGRDVSSVIPSSRGIESDDDDDEINQKDHQPSKRRLRSSSAKLARSASRLVREWSSNVVSTVRRPFARVSRYNTVDEMERATGFAYNDSTFSLQLQSPIVQSLPLPSPLSSPSPSRIPRPSSSLKQKSTGKRVVAMVGDGINDSVALAAADIGIALGTGTDVAMEAADVVILNSSLLDLVVAVDLSHTIFRRIQINFFWAGFYNVISIPLAMGIGIPWGVMLHPMAAGAAMVFSSVSVVLSSLLLRRYKRPKWVIQASDIERHGMLLSSNDEDKNDETVVLWDHQPGNE